MKVIVLSIPHSGTHFVMKLLGLMGVDAEYAHFQPSWEERIRKRLENIQPDERVIIPFRCETDIQQSWINRDGDMVQYDECWGARDRLVPLLDSVGFFMLPVARATAKIRNVDTVWALAAYLNIRLERISVELMEFVTEWPVIKSWNPDMKEWRDENPKAMSGTMSSSMLKEIDDGA